MPAADSLFHEHLGDHSSLKILEVQFKQNREAADTRVMASKALLEARIARLRAENAQLPINQFPLEILCEIFGLAAEDGKDVESALNISQTCFFWRDAALHYQAMWSYVDLSSPVAELYLTRTKGHLLTLRQKDWLSEWGSKTCQERLRQVKTLEIDPSEVPSWVVDRSAPSLVILHLNLDPEGEGYLSCLFSGQAPGLRTLRLSAARMPWTSGAYVNLTTLDITTWNEFIDDEDIVCVFRDSPYLIELRLNIHPDYPRPTVYHKMMAGSSAVSVRRRIVLGRLKYMMLNVPYWYAYHILASVDMPAILDFDVTIWECRPAGIDDYIPAHVFDPTCLPSELIRDATALTFLHDFDTFDGISFKGKKTSGDGYLVRLVREFKDPMSRTDDVAVALSMLRALSQFAMPRLSLLDLDIPHLDDTAVGAVISAISHLRSVETLKLTKMSQNFIAAFAEHGLRALSEFKCLDLYEAHLSVDDVSKLHKMLPCSTLVVSACTILIDSLESWWQALEKLTSHGVVFLPSRDCNSLQFKTPQNEILLLPVVLIVFLANWHGKWAHEVFQAFRDLQGLAFRYSGKAITLTGTSDPNLLGNPGYYYELLHLDFTASHNDAVVGSLLRALKPFAMPDVQELAISVPRANPPPVDMPHILQLLYRYPSITHLTLTRCSPQFMDALSAQCELGNAPWLPMLRMLTFDSLSVRLPAIYYICAGLLRFLEGQGDVVGHNTFRSFSLKRCSVLIPLPRHALARCMFTTFCDRLWRVLDIYFNQEESIFQTIHGQDVGISVHEVYQPLLELEAWMADA